MQYRNTEKFFNPESNPWTSGFQPSYFWAGQPSGYSSDYTFKATPPTQPACQSLIRERSPEVPALLHPSLLVNRIPPAANREKGVPREGLIMEGQVGVEGDQLGMVRPPGLLTQSQESPGGGAHKGEPAGAQSTWRSLEGLQGQMEYSAYALYLPLVRLGT